MIDERQMADDRHDEDRIKTARNLPDMARGENSLQGYVAMNYTNVDEQEEIAQLAYEYYEERGRVHGFAEEDWFRAEQEVRRRRTGVSA